MLSERTRWVAVTHASNAVGTIPDLAGIVAAAHEAGARVYVDAVHAAPHRPLDVAALGCDALACSAYKWFGPHIGVQWARPDLLAELAPDKLLPSPDTVPDRWENGTLPFEALAGVAAAADYTRGMDWAAVRAHEDALLAAALEGLDAIPGVTVHGRARDRTSTLMFNVEGRTLRRGRRGAGRARGRGLARQLLRLGARALPRPRAPTAPSAPASCTTTTRTTSSGCSPRCARSSDARPPAAGRAECAPPRVLRLVAVEALVPRRALAQRGQREARALQRGDVGLDRAVMPDHGAAEPVELARPRGEVVVDDPVSAQILRARPRVMRRDHRVGHRDHVRPPGERQRGTLRARAPTSST